MKGLYFLEQDSLESFTLALFCHLSPNPDQVVRQQCDTLSFQCQLEQFVSLSILCGVIQDTVLSTRTVCQIQYSMWSHLGCCAVSVSQDSMSVQVLYSQLVCQFGYFTFGLLSDNQTVLVTVSQDSLGNTDTKL